eukprot:6106563-Pyramimonas_sp.AAC.1
MAPPLTPRVALGVRLPGAALGFGRLISRRKAIHNKIQPHGGPPEAPFDLRGDVLGRLEAILGVVINLRASR